MKALRGIAIALGVIAVVWAGLFVVAFFLKSIPHVDAPKVVDAGVHAPNDAGVVSAADAEIVERAAPVADVQAPVEVAVEAHHAATPIFGLCPKGSSRGEVRLMDLVGDPRPELAVVCGSTWHILAVDLLRDGDLKTADLRRVLTFEAVVANSTAPAAFDASAIALGDIDGNGSRELIFGFSKTGVDAQGGLLAWLPRDANGSFGHAHVMASFAAADLAFVTHDGKEELVALNRTSIAARRPSEVWIYGTGTTQPRTGLLRAGMGASSVAFAPMHANATSADVAVLAEEDARIDIFKLDTGPGSGAAFGSFGSRGAHRLNAVDINQDGKNDVLALGATAGVIYGGRDDLEVTSLAAMNGWIDLVRADYDADGKAELVGISAKGISLADVSDGGPTNIRAIVEFGAGVPTPDRILAADFDLDGDIDYAIIFSPVNAGDIARVAFLPGPISEGALSWPKDAPLVRDAPFALRVTLP